MGSEINSFKFNICILLIGARLQNSHGSANYFNIVTLSMVNNSCLIFWFSNFEAYKKLFYLSLPYTFT